MTFRKEPLIGAGVLVLIALTFVGSVSAGAEGCGCCWFTGGGTIMTLDGRESFGGNAITMKDGDVQGQWQYVMHGTGDIFHGSVTDLLCYLNPAMPGPGKPDANSNFIEFTGTGVLNHQEGYTFIVQAYDSGEPAFANVPGDYYAIRIWDPSGTLIVDEDGYLSGNFQIHPSNNGHPCP